MVIFPIDEAIISSPTMLMQEHLQHQVSQRGREGQLDKPAQFFEFLLELMHGHKCGNLM
jgi:hypothetical protein